VATLFKDYRQAKAGPVKAERGALLDDTSLGQDCFAACMGQSGDGRVYAVAGHEATWIVRVDGLETIRRLPESEVVVTAARQEAAMSIGAISPKSNPGLVMETLEDGRRSFRFKADFQKDKKAIGAVSSGSFASNAPATAHCNGIYGAPTVYKFFVPGDLQSIEATAIYGNHADAAAHAYGIRYSLDGTTYNALIEKDSNLAGEVKLDGKVDVPKGTRCVWVSFAGVGNWSITLKQVDVKLIFTTELGR